MDSSPRPEPTDPLVALATEVGALGRRLDRIGADLLALRTSSGEPSRSTATAPADTGSAVPNLGAPAGAGATPPPGTGQAGQQWAPPPGAWGSAAPAPPAGATGEWGAGAQPAGLGQDWAPPPRHGPTAPGWAHVPHPAGGPAPASGATGPAPGRTPVPGAARDSTRSALSGARLLAWTGGAVTLLGVVMFIVLAAQRGWFSPEARIVAGAVLGVVLVGLGMRLHRQESARTGALALAGTGFATLYLVVAGATFIVGLLETPAVVLALVVAAAGLGLADRWRSQLLAGGVVIGAGLLAPVLVGARPLLVALVLALQVAAVPVVLRRQWSVLGLLAAAGPVFYGALVVAFGAPISTTALVLMTLAVLLVGLGTAALATRRLPAGPVAALVASAPLPVLVAVPMLSRWGGTALAAGAGLALLAVAALPTAHRVVRQVASAAAAVAIFEATAMAFDGSTRTAVLLGQATVLAVLATALRSRLPLGIAGAYGLVGVLTALVVDAPLAALVAPAAPYLVDGRPVTTALVTGLVVSALVLALAVALVVAAGRLGLVRPDATTAWLWVPVGLVGLYGAAGLVITAALLVTGDAVGFTAGHALVTVSWTVGALVLLARGISRQALRITGLALVAAAVAKLVLFDLRALDGIAQVAAFLGAGLVILAAGTRYARLVTEAEAAGNEPAASDEPTQPSIAATSEGGPDTGTGGSPA